MSCLRESLRFSIYFFAFSYFLATSSNSIMRQLKNERLQKVSSFCKILKQIYKVNTLLTRQNINNRNILLKHSNHRMQTSLVIISMLAFVLAMETDQLNILRTFIFTINVAYFYKYTTYCNFTQDRVLKYSLYGQNLYALFYLIWLSFYNKKTYIFYVPLFFSTLAKSIWLFTTKDKLNFDFLQEAALFQTKTEIFIMVYEIFSIFYGGFGFLPQLFFLLIIFKFKYGYHEKAQEAVKQLHFELDNRFKGTKIRAKYQKLVQIMSLIGETYGGSKQIIY